MRQMKLLNNFVSGELVEEKVAKRILAFADDGNERYRNFRTERFVEKSVKLSATIKNVNLPKFKALPQQPKTGKVNIKSIKKELGLAQRQIDIARSKGITMKEILTFDLLEDSFLFDEGRTYTPNKSQLTKCLEAFLEPDDFCFSMTKTAKTSVIIDFMSLIRKIPIRKLNTINDVLKYMWKTITNIAEADEIHIVYDSYLENSLKGHERLRRSAEVEPIEFVNLSKQSPVPVQLERFWACSVNKVNLQSISRKFFAEMSQNNGMTVVLSSCVTESDGVLNCEMFCGDAHSIIPELNSEIEEADARLIPHLQNAVLGGSEKIIVSSTDTDVLVLLIHYFESISDQAKEVWNQFGTGDKTRYIPVHSLVQNIGKFRASSLLAAHILSGCDVTSKVGTKAAAIKQIDLTLPLFGQSQTAKVESLQDSERYLVKLLEPSGNATHLMIYAIICILISEKLFQNYHQLPQA